MKKKKNVLRKDFYMEIAKTLNRFISIFLIVAMGVAFFSGIRASEPDMRYTADDYYDAHHLMDIRVLGTLGLTQEDVEAVQGIEGVERAVGSYATDVLCRVGDTQNVFKVMADMGEDNRIDVIEGRMPEKAGECLIDGGTIKNHTFKIGDRITFESGNDSDLLDTLSTEHFTVVGIGSSPEYITFSRGSTTIGDGEVDAFAIVTEDSFSLDVFTKIDVWVDEAAAEVSYTDGYNDKISEIVSVIEDTVADARCEARYQSVRGEADEELAKAQKEYDDAKAEAESELSDALDTLTTSEQELRDGEATIKEKEAELEDARIQIANSEQTLNNARAQLAASEAQLTSGWNEYYAGLEQYNAQAGAVDFDAAKAQIEQGRAQIKEAEAQLKAKEEEAYAQATEASKAEVQKQLNENAEFIQAKAKIEASKAELDQKEAELVSGQQALADAKAQLDSAYAELVSGQAQLDSGKAELASGEAQLAQAKAQLADGQAQLEDAKTELEDGKKQLADGKKEYEDAKAEADEKLADGQKELNDARAEIEDIEYPEWYVQDRSSLTGHAELGDNADRIGAIGDVFPILFFLVAALISLTTMTRMVEEQRIQIGTLKALGYSKGAIAKKYLYYALLATIGGSVVGVLIGEKIFPYIIVNAYKIMYPYISNTAVPYDWYLGFLASLAAVVCIIAATLLACYKELLAVPASLMRPVPPKQGKRILLERMTFLWKHLSFTQKATLRNLFRYKKRFFMMIFGIGGCMALMIVGFGIKDSIQDIVHIQYGEIQTYSGMAILKDKASENELESFYKAIDEAEEIADYKTVYMLNMDISSEAKDMEAYIVVPQNTEHFDQFVYFSDRLTKEEYVLDNEGIIISEKTASMLEVGAGDTIQLKEDGLKPSPVKISAVCENYVGHYIYMTPALFEKTFGKTPAYNSVFLKAGEGQSIEDGIGHHLLLEPAVVSITYMESMKDALNDVLSALDIIVVVLIISAGMLAFIVLYNLNNININERRRELASIKVLGFYDLELAAYVYRENIYLTLIGMLFGCILGKLLHQFIIVTVEIDSCMFGRMVYWPSYVYSMLLTLAFTIFVNFVMFFKLRKIDMVESLKSVE